MAKKDKGGKSKKPSSKKAAVEAVAEQRATTPVKFGDMEFSLDDPDLPKQIDDVAFRSGGYPHAKKLDADDYEEQLKALQIELRKLQDHIQKHGERLVVVVEGRDAAGKGSAISRFMAHLNPRAARAVALSKPTEVERGQWYFQRYANHLPTAGNIVMFDRSWYNRAGVERVMGFCTQDQLADFLREAPQFEGMLVRDGVRLFKIYLDIGREMQLKRMHARRHDPLKMWKVTDIDIAALAKWDQYTEAKEEMFRFTHTNATPWTVIRANDKRRTRLEVMRVVLTALDYAGKDADVIGTVDTAIVGSTPDFFFGRDES